MWDKFQNKVSEQHEYLNLHWHYSFLDVIILHLHYSFLVVVILHGLSLVLFFRGAYIGRQPVPYNALGSLPLLWLFPSYSQLCELRHCLITCFFPFP